MISTHQGSHTAIIGGGEPWCVLDDMFARTQKPVDMFPESKERTGMNVNMFLKPQMRTGAGNDYLFR